MATTSNAVVCYLRRSINLDVHSILVVEIFNFHWGCGVRKEISSMAAEAAWHMGQWDEMSKYLHKPTDTMSQPSTRTAFLTAVHAIHNKDYDHAKNMIDAARGNLSAKIAVLSGESYERAYESLVMGQQLTELEEAIQYSICAQSPGSEGSILITLVKFLKQSLLNAWKVSAPTLTE